jgi:hypothetical protein
VVKVQRIPNFQATLPLFSVEDNFHLLYNQFLQTDLGKIYTAIPWDDLVRIFKLRENKKGPASIFSPRGKIALMFLKHYSGCSDKRLIEQFNGNIYYQFFCQTFLEKGEYIKNYKIVSQIRCEISKKLDIKETQKVLAAYWRPYMEGCDQILMDATCYESSMRYPTDQKLLWESVEWAYGQLMLMCKYLKIKAPRTKYQKWKERYQSYSRKRKKPIKERIKLTRGLLRLLQKLLSELGLIEKKNELQMPQKYWDKKEIVAKVLEQQQYQFETGQKIKDRIVSLSKSYVRPIVRGKETKKVEFGAKVNKLQIDGINFIEHLDFNPFNEGTRFCTTVFYAGELTKTKTNVAGADAIYATNKNRRFATENNIKTDFVRKGKPGKYEKERKQMAQIITKERASRLEGSFGKDKQHYLLERINARTKENEILWIFFGIHTGNALEIGRRMYQAGQEVTKAA